MGWLGKQNPAPGNQRKQSCLKTLSYIAGDCEMQQIHHHRPAKRGQEARDQPSKGLWISPNIRVLSLTTAGKHPRLKEPHCVRPLSWDRSDPSYPPKHQPSGWGFAPFSGRRDDSGAHVDFTMALATSQGKAVLSTPCLPRHSIEGVPLQEGEDAETKPPARHPCPLCIFFPGQRVQGQTPENLPQRLASTRSPKLRDLKAEPEISLAVAQ